MWACPMQKRGSRLPELSLKLVNITQITIWLMILITSYSYYSYMFRGLRGLSRHIPLDHGMFGSRDAPYVTTCHLIR